MRGSHFLVGQVGWVPAEYVLIVGPAGNDTEIVGHEDHPHDPHGTPDRRTRQPVAY